MKLSLGAGLALLLLLTVGYYYNSSIDPMMPTIGDDISVLLEAKQSGLISEQEYHQLKRKALALF